MIKFTRIILSGIWVLAIQWGVHLSVQPCIAQSVTESNAPTAYDARRSLERRIADQSGGYIKLLKWQFSTPYLFSEMNGKKEYIAPYKAEVEVSQPGKWLSQTEDATASFTILKPGESGSNLVSVIDVSIAGERFIIQGTVIFTHIQNGWRASDFKVLFSPQYVAELMSTQARSYPEQYCCIARSMAGPFIQTALSKWATPKMNYPCTNCLISDAPRHLNRIS